MTPPQQNNNLLKPPLEGELLSRIINKDMIVLDIGANTGSYTVFLSILAKFVYAFEPEPNNFKELENNTQNLDNVNRYPVAISDKFGYATLYICPSDNGMNRLYNSKWCEGGEQIEVITTTIDRFIGHEVKKNKISFIKMDIEGYEYHAIKGMTKFLQRDHPIIMMEWHPPSLEEAGTDPREFYNFMKDELGYGNPKHCYLPPGYPTINTYEELNNYTRDIPAINILWQ